MNKKNIKPLILSSLAALSLGSMSVAGTFALFTDKAETKVEIQAGVVDVDAEISDLAFYELGVTTPITNTDSSGAYVNSIGGTAKINGSTLVLNKWAPGDKVTFKLTVKNKSNVDIRTRLRETHSTTSSVDLYEALDITYARDSGLDADKIFHWNKVGAASDTVNGDTVSVLNVTIEFPNHGDLITAREEGIDNHYQNSNCTIVFSQQAVQGNAEAVDLVSQWNQYLAESEGVNNSLTAAIAEVRGTEAQLKSERIVWNAAQDKFYYEEEVAAADRYKYFKAYDAMPVVQNWSVYATSSWTSGNAVSLKGIGFDVGSKKDSITSVSYVGESAPRINRIYTNSASTNITINAPLDTVQHYGVAGILDIQAVAGSSYHEFGKVAFVEISKGRIALEKNSEVAQIHVEKKTESTFDEIIISKHLSVELPTLSRDDVTIPSGGTLVVALQEGTGIITTETDLDYVWLTKQGVYKQIAISDNKNNSVSQGSSTTVYADQLSSSKQETQTAAQQIANNIVDQVVIGNVTYNVSVDTTSRDIVLTNDAQPSQKASAEATAAAIAAGDVVKESGLNETKKGQAAAEQVAIVTVEENDDNAARIGTHGYATLEAAVAAAGEGSTVVLLKDVSLGVNDSCIGWKHGRFSLDLNGHTMRTDSEKGVELNNNGYTSGVFYMSEFDRPVTIKNGTVVSKYGTAIYIDGNTADNVATIENVVATNEQYDEGKGGSTHYASAVRVTSAGHVLIKSGVFSGYNAIDLESGEMADVCTIEGGTFNGRLTVASSNAQLIIKGGTFNGQVNTVAQGSVIITGGTFSTDVNAYCAAGYRAKQVGESSWQVVEMCQNHNFQYNEIDETHHKKVCTICGYEEVELHQYHDDCAECYVCGHDNYITLTAEGEVPVQYTKVTEAFEDYNSSSKIKKHTLDFGPGNYHLPVNTIMIKEDPSRVSGEAKRSLDILGSYSGNQYTTVLTPEYREGLHNYRALLAISGMSSYSGGGVEIKNISFDLSEQKMLDASSGLRAYAVYCLCGGSGSPDPIFGGSHRYAHDIVVEQCHFSGPSGKYANAVGSNQANCQPKDVTIKNCTGEGMNCWYNGYGGNITIENCAMSDLKPALVVGNFQAESNAIPNDEKINDPLIIIKNVSGSYFAEVTKDGHPTPGSASSEKGAILSKGGKFYIIDCNLKGYSGSSANSGFYYNNGNTTNLYVSNSTFTRMSTLNQPHDIYVSSGTVNLYLNGSETPVSCGAGSHSINA